MYPGQTHLKGIEPPHMVPETTALSTELQVLKQDEKFTLADTIPYICPIVKILKTICSKPRPYECKE